MSRPPPLAPLSWRQVVVAARARGHAGAAAIAGCPRDAPLSRFYWHDPTTLRHYGIHSPHTYTHTFNT
eukprot:82534-Pyramimonas_sp.AAC.1